MQKEYLVPVSIFAGCTVIAVGLFLGLRERPEAPSVSSAASPALATAPSSRPIGAGAAATPPEAPATPPAAVAPPAVSPDVQAVSEAAAKKALEAEKKASFVPRCWEPALARAPEPKRLKVSFDITFDPSGKEVGRGISEDRSAMRPDAVNCLRGLGIGLRISPPPGVHVRMQIPMEFP